MRSIKLFDLAHKTGINYTDDDVLFSPCFGRFCFFDCSLHFDLLFC